MSNQIESIQNIYACFGVGDIPGIMEKLTDDAVFEHNGKFPWSGRFEGKAKVGEFFQALGNNVTVTVFNPSNFRAEGNQVINDCRFEAVALASQKAIAYDLKMVWTFDDQGRPTHYEGIGDESQLSMAEAAFSN